MDDFSAQASDVEIAEFTRAVVNGPDHETAFGQVNVGWIASGPRWRRNQRRNVFLAPGRLGPEGLPEGNLGAEILRNPHDSVA